MKNNLLFFVLFFSSLGMLATHPSLASRVFLLVASRCGAASIPKATRLSSIVTHEVFKHAQNLVHLSELNVPYETSRSKARDYIVKTLTSQTGKHVFGVPAHNALQVSTTTAL
jgi:hypothetical protein